MQTRRISEPAAPAVPVAMLREHLRVSDAAQDVYVLGALSAATGYVERYLRRSLIAQVWRLDLDAWPTGPVELPFAPVIAVMEVRYIDPEGADVALDPGVWLFHPGLTPARLALAPGQEWPAVRQQIAPISITYRAGYGETWNAVPEDIRHAIMMMAAHFYENREAVVVGTTAAQVPAAVTALLEDHQLRHWI